MDQRKLWLENMKKIAFPVLTALSQGKLHACLPLDFHPGRSNYALLEAFGRTMCGISPWLEAVGLDEEEAALQSEWVNMVQKCLDHATNPASPDYMNFTTGDQPLVDAAFLAHAIVRAPRVMGSDLNERVRRQVISALEASRVIHPGPSNWLFFSAMVETALHVLGADYRKEPIDRAVRYFLDECYVGDGTYGDGKPFHWDYYNSFVIQPMLVDILRVFDNQPDMYPGCLEKALVHATRFSKVLEQFIGPDGTYTVMGRSSTYRFGCFHLLAQAVQEGFLDPGLLPGQVRAGLSAVIQKCLSHPDTFDENGYLRPGIYGYQPSMAEGYISVGSLYLCCFVFVVLGLSPDHPFWTEPDADWTAKKLWSGADTVCDHCRD